MSLERRRLPRRVTDQLTLGLLIATVGVVAVAFVPPMLHALFDEEAPAAKRGIARALWKRGYAVGPTEAKKASPQARSELDSLFSEHGTGTLPGTLRHHGAVTRGDVVLRAEPSMSGISVGTVRDGTPVVVIREHEDWLMVARGQSGDLMIGWLRRSDVASLP